MDIEGYIPARKQIRGKVSSGVCLLSNEGEDFVQACRPEFLKSAKYPVSCHMNRRKYFAFSRILVFKITESIPD
jgi:hypothetical protein